MSKLIEEAVTAYAGERCSDFDPGCVVCKTWADYDRLKQMEEELLVMAFKPVVIEAVARVALEDPEMRSRIGHELDLSEEELVKVWRFLEALLNEGGMK